MSLQTYADTVTSASAALDILYPLQALVKVVVWAYPIPVPDTWSLNFLTLV